MERLKPEFYPKGCSIEQIYFDVGHNIDAMVTNN
jgi:hypothetical protein